MITRTRSGPFTFADFLEMVSEDQKADLIDGVIHMASPENVEHNELVWWLGSVLGMFVQRRGLGKISINKVAYRLSDKNAPEPDVAVLCTPRLGIRKRGYIDGPPDLAVEIVSPESVERDYDKKRRQYEEAGVGEYWIIDPDETRASFLILESGGFSEADPEGHIFRSRVISGFALDIRWLWQDPLPDVFATVEPMLQE